jgi:glycosyltransferase involved in cell wall biosynthesis
MKLQQQMDISGFTFIRNGEQLGYPYLASIRSILPICHEFVIAVGESEDNTLQILQSFAKTEPKIRIIPTKWNEKMTDRGFVYAQQKMIAQFNCTGDWVFYFEGDEVLHEDDLEKLLNKTKSAHCNPEIEALVFDYYHFFGSPSWLATSPGWYRRAPRLLRNTLRNYSPDGLFFVVMDKNKKGRYPKAALANVPIYHYGHVRQQQKMQKKVEQVSKYWGHDNAFEQYKIDPQALTPFSGNHPKAVEDWIEHHAEKDFIPDANYLPTKKEKKHRWMMKLENLFGLELSKKHYQLVKG